MVNGKLRQLKKSWLLLPVLWSQNLISITEGSLWKLFHLISQFPKVGVSWKGWELSRPKKCVVHTAKSFILQPGEEKLQQDHGKEQKLLQVGKVKIFGLFFCRKKMFYLAYLFCFNSVAFVLLGWERVICDLEHICVPEWSQSVLAWREMCYCFLLWHCCCWLKGSCCALLLKLRESSIDQPTALGGG